MKNKKKFSMSNALIYLALSLLSVVWLIPIVWLVITSFRAESGAYTTYIMPKAFTFDNYIRLFTNTELFSFPQWFMNTLLVAIVTCILSTLFVFMVSYTLSRLRFKGREKLMSVGLILTMFPGFMSMIAVYHILKVVHLDQTLTALVLVYSAGAVLQYFIAKGFLDTIPKSLDEAAILDGANRHQIFWKIILPMSKPILVYTALVSFMTPWVDFIFVSVIMKDNYDKYTVAVGLFQMLTRENIYEYFTRFCAGAVIVSIPITILFIFMQQFYVKGVTGGSVKG